MKSPMKKAVKQAAPRKAAAKAPAAKNAATRSAAKKAGGNARANVTAKKTRRAPASSPLTKKGSVRKAAPVSKTKKPSPRSIAPSPRKAAPAKRPVERTLVPVQPKASTRILPGPTPQDQPTAEHEVLTTPEVHHPAPTYDPTPDINVPLRGHTNVQHNAQSERAAALKGMRARVGGRRKH